jgi:hypothetical protein
VGIALRVFWLSKDRCCPKRERAIKNHLFYCNFII